jgi:hypothetical protein
MYRHAEGAEADASRAQNQTKTGFVAALWLPDLPRELRVAGVCAAASVEHGIEEVPEGKAGGVGSSAEDGESVVVCACRVWGRGGGDGGGGGGRGPWDLPVWSVISGREPSEGKLGYMRGMLHK